MDKTEKKHILRSLPLFNGLSSDQLRILDHCARHKTYNAGDLIASENETMQALYIVAEGKIKIFKSSAEGKEQTIYLFGPGEPFCIYSAFTDHIFPASAMALEKSSILVFPRDIIQDMAQNGPALLFNILIVLSRRLKECMGLIETLALKEIPQRLASFLLHSTTTEKGEKKDTLQMSITQRELAKILGTTPETLSRVLRKMVSDRIIAMEGRIIRILSRQDLERLASGY